MSLGATRKPDYTIRALNKQTQEKGEVGVAWKNEDGSIYMKFNPFVTVPVGDDFAITAFLIDSQPKLNQPHVVRKPFVPNGPRKDMDDEIPF